MVTSTFSVFVDTVAPQQEMSISSKPTRKSQRVHQLSDATTKENVNPLTGEMSQPPSKKRKPSAPSVLAFKAIASSSKATQEPFKMSSGKDRKEKGKKRKIAALGSNENRDDAFNDTEASLLTSLGNRKAYQFTVMPLADVTQAYDESEASRALNTTALKSLAEVEVEKEAESIALSDIVDDKSASRLFDEMDTLLSKEVIEPEQPTHMNEFDA